MFYALALQTFEGASFVRASLIFDADRKRKVKCYLREMSSSAFESQKRDDSDNNYSWTEQWDSQLFDIERDTVEEFSLNDYFDVNIGHKTRKIVYPIYILIMLASLAMIFLGIFGDEMSSLISILSIITMTWVGVIIGMLGVYLWGTVEDAVDWFKTQNKKFEANVDELSKTRNKIKDIAKNVFVDVRKLQQHSKELTKHLGAFEELRCVNSMSLHPNPIHIPLVE